ncbi:MAG: hypothetical protein ACK5SQ_04030 [Chitinophagales bacterium]|jgi:hypothetical protein
MNRNLIFLPFLALALPSASAQAFMRPIENAAQMALGGAAVALPPSIGGLSNPAQLGILNGRQLSAWSALPYGLVSVRSQGAQALFPLTTLTGLGFGLVHTGMEGYSEQRFQASYGRKLSEQWAVGGSFLIPRVAAETDGSFTRFRVGLGILLQPIPELRFGAVLEDPFPSKDLLTLQSMRLGAHWVLSNLLEWTLEVSKSLRAPAQTRFGMVYQVYPNWAFRLGARNQPLRLAFGVGLELFKGLRCDFASEWHPVLGWTPALMLVWSRPSTS